MNEWMNERTDGQTDTMKQMWDFLFYFLTARKYKIFLFTYIYESGENDKFPISRPS
jgi:hypothetical protein